MPRYILLIFSLIGGNALARIPYPNTRRVEQVDTYHDVRVADPYRWLEDLDADETHQWVKIQNLISGSWFKESPLRERIGARITALWNYPKYGVPFRRGQRYFIRKNDGLQNQSVLYQMEGLKGEPQILIDPNTLSSDGTVALSSLNISRDGALAVYGVSESGSDWRTLRLRSVTTGEDLADVISWVKFSNAAWNGEGTGFYYARFKAPAEGATH